VTATDANHNSLDVNCTGCSAASSVTINDPSVTTQKAAVSAAGNIAVECKVGCAGGATTPTDTFANPTTAGLSFDFLALWNGTTWDRWKGDATNGAFVNVKTSVLPTGAALDSSLTTIDTDIKSNITLHAGTNVIGHAIIDSGSTTAVTGNVASTVADGANVTLGAKTDAKSTSTDGTSTSAISILKEISAMEQAPASRAVTNAGTFPVQATLQASSGTDIGKLTANQSVNVAQLAGTTTDTNSGTKSAGTLRVVLATDQPALTNKLLVTPDSVALPANQSVNLSQIAGSTAVADPCQVNAKVYDSFSGTANTQLITGTSAKKIYFCSFSVIVGAATNVAIVSGTGTVCATGITKFLSGGTTAATGGNFAANGGLVIGNGTGRNRPRGKQR
jgi:hypothetical protein